MQDRFKLRFWDNLEKVMGEVISIDIDGGIVDYKNDDIVSSTLIKNGNIIQCTGLKDKNGKLIFEGDICIYDFEEIGKQKAVIYFNNTYAGFMVKPLRNFQYTKLNNCEIIGNIYETPELQEGNNDKI